VPSPWEQYAEDLPVGDELTGMVGNVTDYGAFVEIQPGLDALLHRTNMLAPCKVGEPHERFALCDQVRCRLLRIDVEAKANLGRGVRRSAGRQSGDQQRIADSRFNSERRRGAKFRREPSNVPRYLEEPGTLSRAICGPA
jgi:predicted RNA-binding protein with RPS1 domain